MDLRGYEEFIIEIALKDEAFKKLYTEMLYKLPSAETRKYTNFEDFEVEEFEYVDYKTVYNAKTFKNDVFGIDLNIKDYNDEYNFSTYHIDFEKLEDNNRVILRESEICAILTKSDRDTGRNVTAFDVRIAKVNGEYKMLVVEDDYKREYLEDIRTYDLDKEQVLDMIDYMNKVKKDDFGF